MSSQYKRSHHLHDRYAVLGECQHVAILNRPKSAVASSPTRTDKLPRLSSSRTDSGSHNYQELTDDEKNDYADFIRSLGCGRSNTDINFNTQKRPSGSLSVHSSYGLADVMKLKRKNEEKHEMTMKVIEDHMWQHKQEERELKRAEGDILKKQLHLKRTMASYSADMNKRKRRKEQEAYGAILELEKKKREYGINDKKRTIQRLNRNIGLENQSKDIRHKGMLATNGLEFQYQKTIDSLRLKRQDIDSLTREFELKLKKKEDEEYELKRRLAELSISLNMESMKQRKQGSDIQRERAALADEDALDRIASESALDQDLRQSTRVAVKNERNKQDLDKYLNEHIENLSAVLREEDRRLTDIRNKLLVNTSSQRDLQAAADNATSERENNKSEEKVRYVTAKRNERIHALTKTKQLQNIETMDTWKLNNLTKTNEMDLQHKEDDILHLKRSVKKQKDSETALFTRAKSTESRRMKLEQNLNKLESRYEAAKQRNARLMQETATRCNKEEEELRNKLLREQSQLAKALNEREDCVQNLVKLRVNLTKEKEALGLELKAHDRLSRIGLRTAEARRQLIA